MQKDNIGKKIFKLAPVIIAVFLVLNFYVWSSYFKPSDANLHFFMLDVGQGDALYFRTPKGQDVLIDGGPGRGVLSELGKVMPFYDRKIDLVILTHPHLDHVGGLIDVLEKYEVGKILMTGVNYKSDDYEEFKDLISEKGVLVSIAQKGETLDFGGDIKMGVLAPEDIEGESIENINNSSVALLLDFKNFEILLPGDAEVEEWDSILVQILDPKIEILKAAHHGSRNGTTEKVLEKIKPEVALISSGKGNSYGHPHKEVISLLQNFGVKYFRTDEMGTVVISSDGENYEIK